MPNELFIDVTHTKKLWRLLLGIVVHAIGFKETGFRIAEIKITNIEPIKQEHINERV